MPQYDFTCASCGPFAVRRPMAEAADPAACRASVRCARSLGTPPGLTRTPAGVASALGIEEKSAHDPDVVKEPRGRPLPGHGHGATPPWLAGHSH